MAYTVYKHTSPDGKVYIGVTCRKVKLRWANGHGYYNNSHFKRAIEKYGWNNFTHEILAENVSKETAYELEKFYIQKFNSTNQNYGYNHHPGGEGSNQGICCSEESRRKRSEKMKGKMDGVFVGGKSPRARHINQYDKDGNLIKKWNASTDIQRELGYDYSTVIRCCLGQNKTSYGYLWLYSEDEVMLELRLSLLQIPKKLTNNHKESIRKGMLSYREKERDKLKRRN